jgi:hypothetical protein
MFLAIFHADAQNQSNSSVQMHLNTICSALLVITLSSIDKCAIQRCQRLVVSGLHRSARLPASSGTDLVRSARTED